MGEKVTRHYNQLVVYKETYRSSLLVHRLTQDFPKHELYSLADQWKRTTRGVCANVAEGYAKQSYSKAEFKRFISIAVGCCVESQVWADYARDLGYIDIPNHYEIVSTYWRIEKMLRKLHTRVKSPS